MLPSRRRFAEYSDRSGCPDRERAGSGGNRDRVRWVRRPMNIRQVETEQLFVPQIVDRWSGVKPPTRGPAIRCAGKNASMHLDPVFPLAVLLSNPERLDVDTGSRRIGIGAPVRGQPRLLELRRFQFLAPE